MWFKIEGTSCFAKVPPGYQLNFELYNFYPDGSKNMLIKVIPIAEKMREMETGEGEANA